jgi:hypothetical protein
MAMRKSILAAAALCLLGATAVAGEPAVELRGFGGALFVPTTAWQDLFYDETVGGGGVTVNSEIAYGLGPYLTIGGWEVKRKIEGFIDVRLDMADLVAGAQWRIWPASWFAPGVRVGGLYFHGYEQINDDVNEFVQECDSVGFEAAADLNFYPFGASQRWFRGWSVFVSGGYQLRPLYNMGDLNAASGWNIVGGIGYRWDLGPKPVVSPPASAAPAPEPAPEKAPAPQPPAPAPPSPRP